MSDPVLRSVLAYVPGDPETDSGLARAMALSRDIGARVELLSVLGSEAPRGWTDRDPELFARMHERYARLEELAEPARAAGLDVTAAVRYGRPSREIIREAARHGHDVVIKMANPADRSRGAVGETAQRLLRNCPQTVWITQKEGTPYRRVLAAIDEPDRRAELDERVLSTAVELAARENAELHVIHSWLPIAAAHTSLYLSPADRIDYIRSTHAAVRDAVDAYLASHETPALRRAHVHVTRGPAGDAILDVATAIGADLLVIGTRARRGVRGYLVGNTAERIIPRVGCSVLVVKTGGVPRLDDVAGDVALRVAGGWR